jgi:hypothetical protein
MTGSGVVRASSSIVCCCCHTVARAGVQKSLLYLESSVTRTADTLQGNKRLAKISARWVDAFFCLFPGPLSACRP